MPKNILDTLIAVGGISGEYEALTEAEIAAAPGAAYTPPEPFENFRVVASRTVQLLGGAPWFFKTFQTSACTLRVPCGDAGTNDAADGRVFFVKNDSNALGDVTVETCGVTGTGPITIVTLSPGDSAVILHEDNDDWSANVFGSGAGTDSLHYRYTNSNGVPNAGTRYYRTGEGARTSSVGDTNTDDLIIRSITSGVDVADTARTYDIELVSDPSGVPAVLTTLTIDGNTGRFHTSVGLSINISADTEFGIRVLRATGTGASSFSVHNISVMAEKA
jgi:hypothetical protein